MQPNIFYKIIEKLKIFKNLSERLGISFKLIFTFALLFVAFFAFFIYIALWHEKTSLLKANDELCKTISKQLAFSTSIPITTERDYFKRRLILRDYLRGLRDQNIPGLLYAGLIDLTGEITGVRYKYAAHLRREYEEHSITKTRLNNLMAMNFSGVLEENIRYNKGYLKAYIYYIPYEIFGKRLGTIEIAFSKDEILRPIVKSQRNLFVLSLFLILLAVPVIYFVGRRIVRPVIYLTRKADEASRGDLDVVIKPVTHDEIGKLSRNFSRMLRAIKVHQKEQIEKERMAKELIIARNIQQSLLPSTLPEFPGFTFSSYFQPYSEASGDYYDFIPIGKDSLGIVIADVSGHGVGAGLVMGMTRTILRSFARGESNPAKLLKMINPSLHEDTLSDMFVTMFYAILNVKSMRITYAIAGHNRGFIYNWRDKRMRGLKTGGIPLGAAPSKIFNKLVSDYTVKLKSGDIFVQYTDGITETKGINGEEFGEKRLIEALVNSNAQNSETMIENIIASFNNFANKKEIRDDITVVSLSVD